MPHLAFLNHLTSAKRGEPLVLANRAQALIAAFRATEPTPTEDESPKIHVSDVVSTFAGMYERMRNAVEYHEEHLLRKNAIERILRRRLVFNFTDTLTAQALAVALVPELIRGGYLPNDTIPESEIGQIASLITPYLTLLAATKIRQTAAVGKGIDQWIISILATDIEEHLVSQTKRDVMVQFALTQLRQDIRWRGFTSLPEPERDLQLELAVVRSLTRCDPAVIRTLLFHRALPQWPNYDRHGLEQLVEHLQELRPAIDYQVAHPQGDAILRVVKKASTIFLVLQDVIAEAHSQDEEILTDTKKLQAVITEQANKRYKAVKSRINRSVFRAVVYIFLTKALLAFIIEFPYQLFVSHTTDYLPLIMNVVFHPIFLFLIAVSVQIPVKKNAERLVTIIKGLLTNPSNRLVPLEIKEPRLGVMTYLYRIVYTAMFLITFGALILFLRTIGFNGVSIFIFLFFISIISFFGIRIRQTTRELIVVEEKENILTTTIDVFTVPILQVGRWISLKAPKVNVLIFFLDYILEAPFKLVLRVVEDWFSFLREKKEEVY